MRDESPSFKKEDFVFGFIDPNGMKGFFP